MKRLDDIIVSARLDTFDTLFPLPTGGKDQDRCVEPLSAPALEYGEAVHLRQAEVENDGVEVLGVGAEPDRLAIAFPMHLEAHLPRALSSRSAMRWSSSPTSTLIARSR